MVYLMLAIMSSASVSLVMRVSQRAAKNSMSLLAVSYATCMIVSLLYMGVNNSYLDEGNSLVSLSLGCCTGLLFLLGFILLQQSIAANGMVLSGTFAKLGVLVPTVLSLALFGEHLKLYQAVGVGFALFAIWYMNGATLHQEQRASWLLMVLLLANGLADFMSKVFSVWGQPSQEDVYLLVAFGVACIISCILAWHKTERLSWKTVVYGALLGVPNFFSVKFLIGALAYMPASIVYPTYSVATILVISLLGVFLFGERLSMRQRVAQGIIVLSLVLLNM